MEWGDFQWASGSGLPARKGRISAIDVCAGEGFGPQYFSFESLVYSLGGKGEDRKLIEEGKYIMEMILNGEGERIVKFGYYVERKVRDEN